MRSGRQEIGSLAICIEIAENYLQLSNDGRGLYALNCYRSIYFGVSFGRLLNDVSKWGHMMLFRRGMSVFTSILLLFVATLPLSGCGSSSHESNEAYYSEDRQSEPNDDSYESREKGYDSYSDILTPFPGLYSHDPVSGWLNVYDESKVISYSEARNYVGQEVTVEGMPSSVVYAGSSGGSPYFFNLGNGDFAAIVWSQDLMGFDQNTLYNYVEWSKSGQPINVVFRFSGVVEMYDGRPQITIRDGSQIATLEDDQRWSTMMSVDSVDTLMAQRYE